MNTAMDRGTAAHNAMEQILQNKPLPDYSTNITKMHVKNYLDLLTEIDAVHGTEVMLYGRDLGLAGTIDCLATIRGELTVVDFKTKRSDVREEWLYDYYLQTSAYALMLREAGHEANKISILVSSESTQVQSWTREVDDYIEPLKERIQAYFAANRPHQTQLV